MITVHHLNNSRSQRVLWLLEELGVEYDVKRYQRHAETMFAPPELKAVHPLGKSPVVTDGEHTFAESGAIVEYFADRYADGRLARPHGSAERFRYLYWLHYAEGSAMTPLLARLMFDRVASARVPFFVRPILRSVRDRVNAGYIGPQLSLHLDYLESELAQSEWFAGAEFSAADIQMSFPLELAVRRASLNDSSRQRLKDFLRRIHERPAYQRALERGGAYAFA